MTRSSRSGLWPDARAVHRSSISKARQKVPWQVFPDILLDAVKVAYDLWPQNAKYLWHGMSVYATDGSKYNLPATDDIRGKFDPNSGLQNKGKGHYPQCLISTLYDVFRRLPIARTVVGNDSSEREEIKSLMPFVPAKSVWLFDRGYPGYESILYLKENYDGHFIFRSPASCTFPAVETFIKKGKKEDIIWIAPSNKFISKVGIKQREELKPIKLRVIRLVSPDGTVSVLLTDLFKKKDYKRQEIIDLYFRRWEVESYYRDEKITLEIEKFHSKTVNGILQEFYAAMIMSVISRTLMVLSSQSFFSGKKELQFKNAILTLASEAAFLVADDPQKAITIFKEILEEIARVKYYRPKKPRSPQPRVNKSPLNKWDKNKIKRSVLKA
ncbi:MAG: IS4 family transposase [Desulfobacterales bacterium]